MKLLRRLFSRVVLVSLGIAIQLAWLFLIMFYLSAYYLPIAVFLNVISLVVVLFIIKRPGNPQIKMAWIVPILIFPLFGGLIFLLSGGKRPKKKLREALEESAELVKPHMQSNIPYDLASPDLPLTAEIDLPVAAQCHYLHTQGYTAYRDTAADYYADCRAGWERMLEDLERAERFIFMEYFIINPGKMWDPVLEILKRKAAAGVDVRLMYDDVGSINYVSRHYHTDIEKFGIKCVKFNPYRPVYAVVMNHRDHRKILVVDGNVGYTGGINFADEYIGEDVRFGEWQDNVLRMEGEGVRSMTLLFLDMWNASRPTDSPEQIADFMPDPAHSAAIRCSGYVQPYGNFPVKNEMLAENVYLNLINQASKYVYIFTPYLVIDHEMSRALSLAALRGVDVRIVVPGIPDKKIVYELTQSYFPELMENGVKIYKFTPGFLHSKVMLTDDRLAVVGSVNLDYRSLLLHFENAVLFVDHSVLPAVKADFEATFPRCEPVMAKERRFRMWHELYLGLLRLFAPLL